MMTEQTAQDIALAYREIRAAEALLANVEEEMKKPRPADFRDCLGRPHRGIELGVPMPSPGGRSWVCHNVEWPLAKVVIEAHIASLKSRLAALNVKAKAEVLGALAADA